MQTFWDTPYGSFVVQVLGCGGRVKNLKNTDFYNFQAILTAPDILQAKINAFIVKESLNQRVFKKQVFSLLAKKVPNFVEPCYLQIWQLLLYEIWQPCYLTVLKLLPFEFPCPKTYIRTNKSYLYHVNYESYGEICKSGNSVATLLLKLLMRRTLE